MREKAERRKATEAMHAQLKELRKSRAQWTSEKSDCIGFAKMLVDYFNFVNSDATGAPDEAFSRCDEFCRQNDLNPKVMKEAHFLCI